jgi:DNA-binding PadR family transcriptional regulator
MLLALLEDQRHGYALKEDIAARSGGRVLLGPGTLYRTIRDLLRDGLIEETESDLDPADDDERRRYYRISDLGRSVVAAEARRLESLVEIVRGEKLIP